MKGSVTRVLALVVAAAVLMCGLLGQAVMTAPAAQALTEDEQIYISLLVSEGIGPTADNMVCVPPTRPAHCGPRTQV